MLAYDLKSNPSSEWIEQLRKKFPTHAYVDETLTKKLLNRASGPHRSQAPEIVAERLRTFLDKHLDAAFEITDLKGLAGGSSKEQYAFKLKLNDSSETGKYVLRMRPAESIVETHLLREVQALKAVAGKIPVPEVLACDPEGEELGQPAVIYTFNEGVTAPPYKGAYSPRRGIEKKYRDLLAPQFVKYFAALGMLDWSVADMSAFDQPTPGTREAAINSINWWQRVWEEDSLEPYPLMTITAQWLRENAPVTDKVSIVHSDFRKGNFLFDLESCRITSVLDWELSHLGDRHEDLAFFLNPLFAGFDEDNNPLSGGLIDREEFIAEYQKLSGLPVDQDRIDYYMIFNAWRCVINTLATGARCIYGQKTHQDIRVGWITFTYVANMKTLLDEMKRRI